jgi:RNA polymerase sigma-70 factor, ECF subfamily
LSPAQPPGVESPKAFLSAVTTRLSIDELRSARIRCESHPGEWLPEPLLTGDEADPAGAAEQADSLSMAFLLLLSRDKLRHLGPLADLRDLHNQLRTDQAP